MPRTPLSCDPITISIPTRETTPCVNAQVTLSSTQGYISFLPATTGHLIEAPWVSTLLAVAGQR
jgi:hypothetical protein